MKVVALLTCSLFIFSSILAQNLDSNQWNAISSGGSSLQDLQSGYTLDWAIGQSFVETVKNEFENIEISQGFLQSRFITTGIGEPNTLPFKTAIFPNPSAKIINIEADFEGNLGLDFFSVRGHKILSIQKFQGSTQIPVTDLPPGNYFISIFNFEQNIYGLYRFQKI